MGDHSHGCMRRQKAKRLSKFLFETGLAKFDVFQECLIRGLSISFNGKYFVALLGSYQRYHTCCFSLVKLVYTEIQNYSCSSFQRQLIFFSNMPTVLSSAISQKLVELDVPVFPIAGFRHNRPKPLTKFKGACKEVIGAFEDVPARFYENYHHSSHETNISLLASGYTVLVEKPSRPADYDTFKLMFIRMALESPKIEVEPRAPIRPETMMSEGVTSSSAGLLPLNSMFGNAVGNKKEMQAPATAVNWNDALNHIPGCLPAKPCAKDEVIKKGKKVRTIMVESEANFLVWKHFFEDVISKARELESGSAIGLSTLGGGFKQIFLDWYWVFLRHFPSTDWNQFLDWLDKQTADESDKTAWEASTNMLDGLVYAVSLLVRIPVITDRVSLKLLSRAFADYFNPAVQIDAEKVFFAPWRILSGSYPTAHGNTHRHRIMVLYLCDSIELHDFHVGLPGCACIFCERCQEVPGFGREVSPLSLDLLRAAKILGDDFIAVSEFPIGPFLDNMFGTTTKGQLRPVFSSPGLEEPQGMEFLRKHFYLDKRFKTYNVRSFRAAERVLAKLYHGRSSADKSTFKAALLSAMWEGGYNRPLYDILSTMWDSIGDVEPSVFSKQLEKYVQKSPGVLGSVHTYKPAFETIVNADASIIKPLEKVFWGRLVKGMYGLAANLI